jgi:acetyl-CoA carboxylase carboxyltransferase component
VPPKKRLKLAEIIPDDSRKSYDVKDVIKCLVDGSEFFEVQEMYATNVVVGFARLNGESIGIIANQPKVKAGCLDVNSSDKAARFVRFCDAFGIPLLTLVDLPGYLPGVDQEHAGIIRHGAKMIYAYSEASVPKVSLILRKAFGGGYIAMSSKHLKTDFVFALPSAEIAVMGPESACSIIFAKEIREADDPEAVRQQKIAEYKEKFSNPYNPASKGYIDAIIHPDETRQKLIQSFELAADKKPTIKKHKHGSIPL